jgi:ABC-type sugar transport system ATPase subunit
VVQVNGVSRFKSPTLDIAVPDGAKLGAATLGIRPEHVVISRNGSADTILPVRLVEPLGKDTLLYFDDSSERAFVAVSEGLSMADVEVGARLNLNLASDQLHLFGSDGRRIGAAT